MSPFETKFHSAQIRAAQISDDPPSAGEASTQSNSSEKSPKALWVILSLGLIVRILHWWTVKDMPFFAELVMDSQEYDRWAGEIYDGDWLGSEVFFQAPLYPYLLAVLYSIFGRSYNAIYLFQIALSVIGGYGIYRTGAMLASRTLGCVASALIAGLAVLAFYDVQILKESLAVSMVCLLLWALTEARARTANLPWLPAGLITGVLILLRENTLLLLPLFALLTFSAKAPFTSPSLLRSARRFGLLLFGVILILSPVAIRNQVVGGDPLPTTFQGGTNFFIGNNPDADGTYRPIVPGKQIPIYERNEPIRLAEAAVGKSLSAAEVSSYWLHRSLAWAQDEPADFFTLQIKKLSMFWCWYEWPDAVDYYFVRDTSPVLALMPFEFGSLMLLACVGLWQARHRLFSSFLPVTLFMLGWTGSTVIFFIFSRYRLPIAPALALLAALPITATITAIRQKHRAPALAGLLLLLLAMVMPRAMMPEARMDLVHYNLGVIYQQSDRAELAEQHFRQALGANPEHFLAAMSLGRLAAKNRDWQSARAWFLLAEKLEPSSDDIKLNLGAVHMALHRSADAKRYLEEAYALNRKSPGILHNLSMVELNHWQSGTGNLERARELNRLALELQPNHPQAISLQERLQAIESSGRFVPTEPVPP